MGGEETGGKVTSFVEVTPPGGGPPPHYHENEDEWFFPLEGRAEFFLDETWEEVQIDLMLFVLSDITEGEREPMIEPNGITDDFGWKLVTSIAGFHASMVADPADVGLS